MASHGGRSHGQRYWLPPVVTLSDSISLLLALVMANPSPQFPHPLHYCWKIYFKLFWPTDAKRFRILHIGDYARGALYILGMMPFFAHN